MKAAILALLAGMTLLTWPVLVLADEPIPDVRGDWVGKELHDHCGQRQPLADE